MEVLLSRVTQQAMNYAIRSGLTIATAYTLKQCGRLLEEAPKCKERQEIAELQSKLESKIRIVSPAIDMIELISARGNTSLGSAVTLTKEIRQAIQELGVRLQQTAEEGTLHRIGSRANKPEETNKELRKVITDINRLLMRIEDAVPLINLAITTSGVSLSTKLSGTISPSRLLQASTFLSSADADYAATPHHSMQVGPTFVVSLYMLFAGHSARPVGDASIREATWKEVIHKARVKLLRVPLDQLYSPTGESSQHPKDSFRGSTTMAEFAYQLLIVEDLDDDRVHTYESDASQPGGFDDVLHAGIRDVMPVHEVSKIFYADTGKILSLGEESEASNPVLLLKRDVHAEPPRRMLRLSQSTIPFHSDDSNVLNDTESSSLCSEIGLPAQQESIQTSPTEPLTRPGLDSSQWRLPADLDPEWMALEVFAEETSMSDNDDDNTDGHYSSISQSHGQSLSTSGHRADPTITTSLSLLEMLLKLTALQQFRQDSHLTIEDELLNFFLEDSSTAGAGADKVRRQRIRQDAIRRVGFDPYDESPIKRRNEVYIQNARGRASPTAYLDSSEANQAPYNNHDDYEDSPRPIQLSSRSLVASIERPMTGLGLSPSPTPMSVRQSPSRLSRSRSSGFLSPSFNLEDKAECGFLFYPPSSATPPDTCKSREFVSRNSNERKTKNSLNCKL